MKTLSLSFLLASSIVATSSLAAAPTDAPAGSMGTCNDGSYSSSAEKKGACRGHKGVKEWYAEESTLKGSASQAPSEHAAPPAASSMSKTPVSDKPSSPAIAGRTSGAPMNQAPGGGAGQVWANENTKVYHCSGDKWYGKTKHGEYLTESDAKAKGYHADHGKTCG